MQEPGTAPAWHPEKSLERGDSLRPQRCGHLGGGEKTLLAEDGQAVAPSLEDEIRSGGDMKGYSWV